jgi:copper oxidase (laccase) domain-containing protein
MECMASRQVAGPDGHLVWWSQVHSDLVTDPHEEDDL